MLRGREKEGLLETVQKAWLLQLLSPQWTFPTLQT